MMWLWTLILISYSSFSVEPRRTGGATRCPIALDGHGTPTPMVRQASLMFASTGRVVNPERIVSLRHGSAPARRADPPHAIATYRNVGVLPYKRSRAT
jgi:hypothetical protein